MTKFELQVGMSKDLKSLTTELHKKTGELLIKIEKEGIKGYYSINSDLLDLALRIHKTSAVLGYMNSFSIKIHNEEKQK